MVDGAEAGAWIEPGLGGEFGAVSLQVPKTFEAYARVFHRALDSEGNHVTWGEVAGRLGRVAHREMQWHQLVGSSDSFNFTGSKWSGEEPSLGELEIEELDRLCDVLARHSADPDDCFFGFCLIPNWIEQAVTPEDWSKPKLELPYGRDHVVARGRLSAVDQIRRSASSGFRLVFVEEGEETPPDPEPHDPVWRVAPNLIWPADRSWLVVSEVDFDSTLVGGSRKLVDALVGDAELEVYEVEPDTSLAAFSDKLNWVAPEEED